MSALSLTKTRLQAGLWEGILVAEPVPETPPELSLTSDGVPVEGVRLRPDPKSQGRWHVEAAIPAALLTEGIRSFVIQETQTGETLAQFAILIGDALEDDLRAELQLLRAEVELLKRAFRRHVSMGAERETALLRDPPKAKPKTGSKARATPKAKPKSKAKPRRAAQAKS
jgi:hypothetical protein